MKLKTLPNHDAIIERHYAMQSDDPAASPYRIKWFDVDTIVAHYSPLRETDDNGIPIIAWDNTEGDTPISAKALDTVYVVEVIYKRDNVNGKA